MECFILAGGKSRRFGEDKLLYKLNGKRTIEHVIEAVKKVCKEVYIVAKEKEKFKEMDVPVILDEFEEYASLIGIYTALKHAKGNALIISGDMPLIKPSVLKKLMELHEKEITIFKDKERIYPFPGIYSKSLLNILEERIKRKDFRIMDFILNAPVKFIDTDILESHELDSFINMNTKEDLKLVIERSGHGH